MSDGNLTFQVQSTVRVQESGHLVNPGKHAREELQATIRACLRELDEERDLLRKTAERWKRDADSDDYWGHHNADLLLDLLPDG